VKAKIEAAAKKYGIDVAEAAKSYAAAETKLHDMLKAAVETKCKPLAKGLWDVGEFDALCARLQSLLFGLIWERDMEQDDSIIPDDLQGHIEGLLDTLVAYVGEEVEEAKQTAAAANKGAKDTMDKALLFETLKAATDGEALEFGFIKAASLAPHFKKAAANQLKKSEEFDGMAKTHTGMAEAMKASTSDELQKSHSGHKALAAHAEKMAGLHKASAENFGKMAEKCGAVPSEKTADNDDLSKGLTAESATEIFGGLLDKALEKAVKPLNDEIALLKAKLTVDPNAPVGDVTKRPKLFQVPRGEGADAREPEGGAFDEVEGSLTKALYA
jgi:hypothetical protein